MRTYKNRKRYTLKRGGAARGTMGKGTMGKGTMGKGTPGKGTMGKGTMGKGKGSRSASVNRPSASVNETVSPGPLKRSLTCSHLIYNSLHNHQEKQEFLKDLLEKTDIKIILRVLTSDMTDDITLRLNDTETGVYITWLRDKTELVTISIHTGLYLETATHKMVKSCIKKGNAHIFFNDLNVSPNQIKITASDELIITPVKLTNSEDANTIITTIIEVLNNYSELKM
jgi:hypothetical protein